MPTLKALLLIPTALLLLTLEGCAVNVSNFTACALVPGNQGAVCDDFLQNNQRILTEPEWEALEAQWNAQGSAVECTTSESVGEIKRELEELCSKYPCNETVKKNIQNLARLQGLKSEAIR